MAGKSKADRGKSAGKKSDYKNAFLICIIILITGIVFESINGGRGVSLPPFPMNLTLGVVFILLLLFMHYYQGNTGTVKMLSRIPAALSSIVLFSVLVLILGLTKQNQPDTSPFARYTGFGHIRNSFVFILSGFYLMTTLGLVILRRLKSWNFRNAGFAMNHLGLWLIVFTGSLAAGDLVRLTAILNEKTVVWHASDDAGTRHELPFALRLLDFSISEFPPKMALVEQKEMELSGDIRKNLPMIKEGLESQIGDWHFTVLKYLPEAVRDSSGYSVSHDTVTVQAALVRCLNEKKRIKKEGWISCGNHLFSPAYIVLDEKDLLAMTRPEAREYSSEVEIINRDGKTDTVEILVNKPVKIQKYKLYQLSYDEERGKYSTVSVIEIIRDPWLPVIYLGIFMLIAGALYLFWIGRNPKTENV